MFAQLFRTISRLWLVSFLFSAQFVLAQFQATDLSDNIFMVQNPNGNTLVAVDSEGLILVDGVRAELAEAYLDFVTEKSGENRIKSLILSHWHPEVTGLNAILGPQGVEIIAHDNTKQWLNSTIRERGEKILHSPIPENHLPTTTFYWGAMDLEFNADKIIIGYLVQAHTDGDVYVRFPAENILYTGPAVLSDGWSVVDDTTNGFIGGLMDGLDTLSALVDDETVIVPGSGPLMNETEFGNQVAMYKSINQEMIVLLRKSMSTEEVIGANPAAGYMPEWDEPTEFLDNGFRSFFGHLRNGRHIGGGFP